MPDETAVYGKPSSSKAYLLKNDDNKALRPAALQEELNNMLKFNPDFAEAVRLKQHCPSFHMVLNHVR